MNKVIIFMVFFISILLINHGLTLKAQIDDLKNNITKIQISDIEMRHKLKDKESLSRQAPVPITTEFNLVLNQLRMLESYSGTSMDVQLEGTLDSQDIVNHFENTEYRDIKGIKIRITVNKFTKETDMGAVLDDIHLLEKNSDFITSEITQDNDRLIVKGEIYGS